MSEQPYHGRIPGAWPQLTLRRDQAGNGDGDEAQSSTGDFSSTARQSGEEGSRQASGQNDDRREKVQALNSDPLQVPTASRSEKKRRATARPAFSPRHPPRDPIGNPPSTPPRQSSFTSALYRYFPIVAPDTSHTHGNFTPSNIRLTSLYLSKRVPADLIPRILDMAEFWTTCTRECKREAIVAAAAAPPRLGQGGPRWKTGQEDEIGDDEREGLKDDFGKTWYLVTEKIGCAEGLDLHRQLKVMNEQPVDEQARDREEDDGWDREDEGGEPAETSGTVNVETKKHTDAWIRQVVVKTVSHDQGWSSSGTQHYGTYEASYTWFELSILRDGKEVEGSRFDFQHNVHAGQYYKEHMHTFGPDSEFVKKLQEGDRVVLWARAMYPGWVNFVREASISVTTAPFPYTFSG